MRVRFRHGSLHLRHRDHWQKTDEEQKERSKNPERANVCPDIHPGWNKQAPGRRKKITMQSTDDNDEALEPHAGVYAHADEIDDIDIPAAPPEPKELRGKHVAEEHADPPVPPVGTKDAIPKRESLVGISAVPGQEKFHHVGVGDE